jgi:hypothetical protein
MFHGGPLTAGSIATRLYQAVASPPGAFRSGQDIIWQRRIEIMGNCKLSGQNADPF